MKDYNPGFPSKEKRVQEIIELMRDLKWDKRKYPSYCERWNVSKESIKKDAAEASRAIRRGIDADTGGAYVLMRLESRIEACMESGDDKALVKLLGLHARLTGAEAAIKYDHTGTVEHDVKAFNPRTARRQFYEKNNRIGDMTDTLNVEVVEEVPVLPEPTEEPLGNEVIEPYEAPESDEPF